MDEAANTERKRPRLGIVVRLLIYLPLLGFFGWRAAQRIVTERRAADDNFRAAVQRWVEHPPKSVVMPNGEVMPVLELSESEAIEMGLLPEGGRPEPNPQPAPEQEPKPAAEAGEGGSAPEGASNK